MKKSHICLLLTAFTLVTTSCDNYLDVNTNPNQPISASAQLVLPQAIVGSAAVSSLYNFNYGGHFGGYIANAGGFSGFGNLLNYNIVPADYDFLWTRSYDNLQDYRLVLDQTDGKDDQAYLNAAARIMTALTFQRLVDAFGDVPYTEAVKGNGNLSPKYDSAPVIYQDLVAQLDQAITTINGAKFPLSLNSSSDPLFGGDMTRWKQFANTLKLRMLIRISGVATLSTFTTGKLAALDRTLGFITADAIVNPGYVKDRPNPSWNAFGYNTTGNLANSSRIPTQFSYGFYNGQKISDAGRGSVIYKNFGVTGATATPINQLGNETGAPPIITNYSTWYTGTYNSATSISNALGVLKGPSQGQPLMLAAESYFLQAEARLKGFLAGDAATSFDQGITASFAYLYTDVTNAIGAGKTVAADVAKYKTEGPTEGGNATRYVVNYALATTPAQRLEAIITQKYIAVNMINSEEGWNEFRRTGFPRSVATGNGFVNIASNKSNSTRADKLPSRILYPVSEQSYNAANYKAINPFTDLIFWDPN